MCRVSSIDAGGRHIELEGIAPAIFQRRQYPAPAPMTTITHSSRELGGFSANLLARLLVVFAFIGVVAVMAIPYLPLHPEQTRLEDLGARLSMLRNAADNYYHQHRYRYPGEFNPADGRTRYHQGQEREASAAFVAQLTQYSDPAGRTSAIKTKDFNLGPYLHDALPENPFIRGDDANAVEIDFTLSRPDAIYPADGRTGWRYYLRTGRLSANDNAPLQDGSQTAYR